MSIITSTPEHLRAFAYCCGRVNHNGLFRSVSCSRRAVVEREGKPYCAQHDPVAVEKRKAAVEARYKLKIAPLIRSDRRTEDYHKLRAALKACAVPKPKPADLAEARELLRRIDVYEEDGR